MSPLIYALLGISPCFSVTFHWHLSLLVLTMCCISFLVLIRSLIITRFSVTSKWHLLWFHCSIHELEIFSRLFLDPSCFNCLIVFRCCCFSVYDAIDPDSLKVFKRQEEFHGWSLVLDTFRSSWCHNGLLWSLAPWGHAWEAFLCNFFAFAGLEPCFNNWHTNDSELRLRLNIGEWSGWLFRWKPSSKCCARYFVLKVSVWDSWLILFQPGQKIQIEKDS